MKTLVDRTNWYCPNCAHGNFAEREECRNCDTARPSPAPTDPRAEIIDRAAHAIAQITHPMFQSDDAWEHAIPMFKEHWRRLARAAFAVYNEDVK